MELWRIAAREGNREAQALAVDSDAQEALANHERMTHRNRACDDVFHLAERAPQIATRDRR